MHPEKSETVQSGAGFWGWLKHRMLSANDFPVLDKLTEILEAHQQFAVLSCGFERVHAAQGRAAHSSSVRIERGAVNPGTKIKKSFIASVPPARP